MIGIGTGQGCNRAETAAKNAVACSLMEKGNIEGAMGVIVCFKGGFDMNLNEVKKSLAIIYDAVDKNAHVAFGLLYDEELKDKIQVTVVATGFEKQT